MLSEVMRSINNHFLIEGAYEAGEFVLVNGKIEVKRKYIVGGYIAITGSVLNNGIYLVRDFTDGVITIKESDANDKLWGETFNGTIYSLRVPQDFLQLVDKITKFSESKLGQASNVTSASFGIQSYSFGTNSAGVRAGWQDVYTKELSKYRRMFPDIVI